MPCFNDQVATDVGCDEDPHRHDNLKLSIEALRDATPMVVYSAKTLSLNPESEVNTLYLLLDKCSHFSMINVYSGLLENHYYPGP